mgnify:CR=1 FL=1
MKKEIKCKCSKCGKTAQFFHSKCCNAHFEGRITEDGMFQIVCEKCGKFVAPIGNFIREIK